MKNVSIIIIAFLFSLMCWGCSDNNDNSQENIKESYARFMQDSLSVSMQNEPDMNFTYWTPAEVVDFVKRFGATIRATGVKLMTPEACGFQSEYTDPILNDAQAFAQSDIIAGHLYQGFIDIESGSYVRNRHDYICGLYNSKLAGAGKGGWWMTEHFYNDGENETDPSKWEFRKWDYNLSHFAKELHMCMEGYCSAYIYSYYSIIETYLKKIIKQ